MISRQRLRLMQERWQRDYDTLEAVYGDWTGGDPEGSGSYIETMRNLATAIAHINGLINARRRGDPK